MSARPPRPTPPTPSSVPTARRWAADPLTLLLLLAVAGAVLALAPGSGFVAPVLLAVVAAGLALAGST